MVGTCQKLPPVTLGLSRVGAVFHRSCRPYTGIWVAPDLAVADTLETEHEVIRASRNSGTRVDLEVPASIDALFETVGTVDAVICCAASGRLTPLASPSDDEFTLGLKGKLMGQVALLRRALHHVRDGGSVTLTSGVFHEPTPGGHGRYARADLEVSAPLTAVVPAHERSVATQRAQANQPFMDRRKGKAVDRPDAGAAVSPA